MAMPAFATLTGAQTTSNGPYYAMPSREQESGHDGSSVSVRVPRGFHHPIHFNASNTPGDQRHQEVKFVDSAGRDAPMPSRHQRSAREFSKLSAASSRP
jgi:hypothetical protein